MALTAETVVQMALAQLGQTETITSITSPSTKAEQLGSLLYASTRDRLNAKHNWTWATRRAALTDVTDTESRAGWAYAYSLPADLLRVVDIDLGFRNGAPIYGVNVFDLGYDGFPPQYAEYPVVPAARWQLEMNAAGTGRVLLCDINDVTLVYVATVTDLDLWDPDAVDALVWALAARLAMPMTAKPEVAQAAEAMAKVKLAEAIADDANEGRPDPVRSSELITVRSW